MHVPAFGTASSAATVPTPPLSVGLVPKAAVGALVCSASFVDFFFPFGPKVHFTKIIYYIRKIIKEKQSMNLLASPSSRFFPSASKQDNVVSKKKNNQQDNVLKGRPRSETFWPST
jgi:hypothetical protein